MATVFIACLIFACVVGLIPFLPVSKTAKRNMTILVAVSLLLAVGARLWLLPAIADLPMIEIL